MSMPYTAPVAREAVEYYNAPGREGFARHPVGTGAYRLKSWERQHRIILAKSPSFRPDFYPDNRRPRRQGEGAPCGCGQTPALPRRGLVHRHIGGPARVAPLSPGVPRWLRHTPGAVRQDDHEEPGAFRRLREEGHIPRDIDQPRSLVHNIQHARPHPRPEQVPAPGPLPCLRQRPLQPDLPERPRHRRPGAPAPRHLRLRPEPQEPLQSPRSRQGPGAPRQGGIPRRGRRHERASSSSSPTT